MLPINDFNFVVAGLATFAATVGYACTRRISTSFVGSDSDVIRNSIRDQAKMKVHQPRMTNNEYSEKTVDRHESECPVPVPTTTTGNSENLKRKVPHDGFEEPEKPVQSDLGYPHNLANIYPPPNKRFKTPPDANVVACTQAEISEKPTLPTTIEVAETPLTVDDREPLVEPPAPEPPLSPSPVADSPSPVPTPCTPPVPSQPTLHTTMIAPVPAFPKSFDNSSFSGGFASFASSTSPFATHPAANSHSAFKPGRSIWSAAPSDLTPHQNDKAAEEVKANGLFRSASPSENVLEHKTSTSAPVSHFTHFTGEEDEDVQMELKGVKLYIKRGANSYGEGLFGHLKILCHRATLEERILFRRDPIWKVSMNIRVQPTVRCTFVPEENALKFILKEDIQSDSADVKQEVVIYVLKPGRSCSKQDFKDFAMMISDNSRFKLATEATSKPSSSSSY